MADRLHHRRSIHWTGIIVFSICALTVSLATRYNARGSDLHTISVKVVKSQSLNPKTQHRVKDAAEWTAPASTFALFVASKSRARVLPPVVPPTNLDPVTWLYNRPPPAC